MGYTENIPMYPMRLLDCRKLLKHRGSLFRRKLGEIRFYRQCCPDMALCGWPQGHKREPHLTHRVSGNSFAEVRHSEVLTALLRLYNNRILANEVNCAIQEGILDVILHNTLHVLVYCQTPREHGQY